MLLFPKLNLRTLMVFASTRIRFSDEDEARLRSYGLLTPQSDLGDTGVISQHMTLEQCCVADEPEGLRMVIMLGIAPARGTLVGLVRMFDTRVTLYDKGQGGRCAVVEVRRRCRNPQQYLKRQAREIAHAIAEAYFEAASPERG